MKVYLSGKMSGLSRDEIERRFFQAEKYLVLNGYNVCNPVRFIFFRWDWLYALLGYHLALCIDLFMLSRCDAIYMIGTDWPTSNGATMEHHYAGRFGIRRMYQEESTNKHDD